MIFSNSKFEEKFDIFKKAFFKSVNFLLKFISYILFIWKSILSKITLSSSKFPFISIFSIFWLRKEILGVKISKLTRFFKISKLIFAKPKIFKSGISKIFFNSFSNILSSFISVFIFKTSPFLFKIDLKDTFSNFASRLLFLFFTSTSILKLSFKIVFDFKVRLFSNSPFIFELIFEIFILLSNSTFAHKT